MHCTNTAPRPTRVIARFGSLATHPEISLTSGFVFFGISSLTNHEINLILFLERV